MKIRNSFVSNSSSSSYIIRVLKQPAKCPTCGRTSTSLIEYLDNCKDYDLETSHIEYSSSQEIIAHVKEEIKHIEEQINQYTNYDRDTIHPRDKEYLQAPFILGELPHYCKKGPTVGEQLDYYKKALAELIEYREKLSQYSDLQQIVISYHDPIGNQLFRDAKDSGEIEVIEDN